MKSSVAFAVGPGPSSFRGGSNAVSTRSSSSISTQTSHVGVASTSSMASSAPVAIPISLSEVCR